MRAPGGNAVRRVAAGGRRRSGPADPPEARSLHGDIELAVPLAAARFESFEMRGGFTLRTRLREASPRERLFDISGTRLDVRRDRIGVSNLEVDGKGLRALADLVLGRQSREGILYLRFHGLSVGIELREEGKDLKLFRPLAWFEKERTRRRASDRSPRR